MQLLFDGITIRTESSRTMKPLTTGDYVISHEPGIYYLKVFRVGIGAGRNYVCILKENGDEILHPIRSLRRLSPLEALAREAPPQESPQEAPEQTAGD